MRNIDITTLSKEEQYKIVCDILKINPELKEKIELIVPNCDDDISFAYIDKLISKHFEECEDVFRKLALED